MLYSFMKKMIEILHSYMLQSISLLHHTFTPPPIPIPPTPKPLQWLRRAQLEANMFKIWSYVIEKIIRGRSYLNIKVIM